MPPRSGIAEPEKIEPPLPVAAALAKDDPSEVVYQAGNHVDATADRPASTSSSER